MNPITYITNLIRKFFQKIKEIMASKKAQKVLIFGSVAATAFVIGKYYERTHPWTRAKWENYPAMPVYGCLSVGDEPDKSILTNTSLEFPLDKLYNIARKFGLDCNLGSVKAASPLQSHEVTILPPVTTTEPSKTSRVSQIMKYGFPSLDNVRSFTDYVVSYDRRTRVANWVFEHLTAESVGKNTEVDRSKCDFKQDESIHPYFRSQNSDYKNSGYDRGHLAAAGNHKSNQKTVEETFYLSNIAPQVGRGFNRDSWNRLEKYVRKLTKTYPNVYCCTGPLYLPHLEGDGKVYIKYEVIGANHVAVPTHFYKIVVGETKDGQLEMEAYVMPNQAIDDKTPLESFLVRPEMIEKAAGLLFFNNITRKNLKKINGKKN